MKEKETHPDWYYPVPNMRTLILGTFPPHKKRWNFSFYYPNKINRFWKVLADLAETPLVHWEGKAAVEERKRLMRKLRVGLNDVGREIERMEQSALDSKIVIIKYQDILGLIAEHKSLEKILLTGYSGVSSTTRAFIRYLDTHKIKHTAPEKLTAGIRFFVYANHTVECIVVNSTSTAARGIGFPELVRQFGEAIARW